MVWKPDYVTLADMKHDLNIGDTADDVELAVSITAASRAVDTHCRRQFGNVAATARTYRAWLDYDRARWVVDIDDLQVTPGTVTIDGAATTDYVLEPRNAVADGLAWTRLVLGESFWVDDDETVITAPWGWSAFPAPVVQATKLQAGRFVARRNAPFGIAGSPDAGSEMRLLARLDPDVAVALTGYRRPAQVG